MPIGVNFTEPVAKLNCCPAVPRLPPAVADAPPDLNMNAAPLSPLLASSLRPVTAEKDGVGFALEGATNANPPDAAVTSLLSPFPTGCEDAPNNGLDPDGPDDTALGEGEEATPGDAPKTNIPGVVVVALPTFPLAPKPDSD